MTYRIIQWATGQTGRQALGLALDHPDLDVVGAYVYSEDKDGVDIGSLVGRSQIGIRATRDKDALLGMEADCVLYNGPNLCDAPDSDADVLAILESGKSVIASVPGYFWPAARGREIGERFDKACAAGSSTLYATGLSPGVVERLAMTLSAVSGGVTEVVCMELYDPSRAARPAITEVMGMGKPPEEFTVDSPRGEQYFLMFTEKAYVYAAAIGSPIETVDRNVRVGVATRDFDIAAGRIAQGTVAAVEWSVRATLADGTHVTCGTQRIAQRDLPGWSWTPGWVGEIEIKGRPNLRLRVPFSEDDVAEDRIILATSAAQIRAIPGVVEAPPGVLVPHEFGQWSERMVAR